jgi:hypothetical protein
MSPQSSDDSAFVPDALMAQLIANGMSLDEGRDPVPVLKLFNPVGPGTWLITEIGRDADTLFGLCDLDLGFPELGYVSLDELRAIKLPFGFRIARDIDFIGHIPLSQWAALATGMGSIRAAERAVTALRRSPQGRPN